MIDDERPGRQRRLSRDPVPNPQPSLLPEQIPLDGRFARLEPLDATAHGVELWQQAGDPAVDASWDYLAYGPWRSEERYLEWLEAQAASSDPFFYAIRALATDRVVGLGSFLRISPEAKTIEIGHLWFSPLLQRTPAATEAIFLLLSLAFDELDYRRVEWKCNALNEPSRRAARRFGFTFDGIFHQHLIVKGRNRDTAWYSILDGEWPGIRAGFVAWLSPENFDEHGTQRHSLAALASPDG
jgi:RimJ/RimL family protein N-acetyltransferase